MIGRSLSVLFVSLFAWCDILIAVSAETGSYEEFLARAEALAEEGSYAMAGEAFEELLSDPGLSREQQEYLRFRQADAAWRSLASTGQSDVSVFDKPRETLIALADSLAKRHSGRLPQFWAEIQESLGDSWWLNNNVRDWAQAWPYYEQALTWWAGSTDITEARAHYLGIVFRIMSGEQPNRPWVYYPYNQVPLQVLENAVKIADTREDRARCHYLLAMALKQSSGPVYFSRTVAEFEATIEEGEGTAWYDDALYQYAEWTARYGASGYRDDGTWVIRGSASKALELYQRLLDSYTEGTSRYYNDARRAIESMTAKEVNVLVGNQFLPSNELTFQLSWRNLDEVRVGIYRIDPEKDLRMPASEDSSKWRRWEEYVSLAGKNPVFTRTVREEGRDGKGEPQREQITLGEGLPAGLYMIEAKGGDKSSRAVLLVTRAAAIAKTTPQGMHVFVANAVTGQPLADAQLLCWQGQRGDQKLRYWDRVTGKSNQQGLGQITFSDKSRQQVSWVLFAQSAEGITLVNGERWFDGQNDDSFWKAYAFTDRPAYRPEDRVSWKFFVRVREGVSSYRVPAGEHIQWRILNPQGSLVSEGNAELNDYGSVWGELELSAELPLGLYSIEFYRGENVYIGRDTLFRLEEYKLPEYKVTVTTLGGENGEASIVAPGDDVKVKILAQYYFGGGVADADVEVVVTRSPYFPWWQPRARYPWLQGSRGNLSLGRHRGGSEQVRRERLKTDGDGVAVLTLNTDDVGNQNWEYTVEARVVDSSRREIIGRSTIRVTQQAYFAYLNPVKVLYRPGGEAEVTIKTLDANNNPVAVSGQVTLKLQRWTQVWRGPQGERISGEEYRMRLRQKSGIFGRDFDPSVWFLEKKGYEYEEVVSQTIQTNERGEATFRHTLPRAGVYEVVWFGRDVRGYPVRQTTSLWAGDDKTQEISYHGDLKIVADTDSFRAGGVTPVMLMTQSAGQYVWFTVEANGLIESRVVRMEGNVALLNLNVTDAWVPNVNLAAVMIQNTELRQSSMAVDVPPVAQFLGVTMTPEADTALPRSTQKLTLQTRDHEGKPVQAEVALSVFDEAVLYIQPTLAPDPREFFYGETRPIRVSAYNSLQGRPFMRERQKALTDEYAINRGAGMGRGFRARDSLNDTRESVLASSASAGAAMSAPPIMAMAAKANDAVEEAAVQVRADFRATMFWGPAIMTDAEGRATVELSFPDSLTTWQAVARAASLPGKVGIGETAMQTSLPLIARLQSPRFLVTGDDVVLSGVINNTTKEEIEARVTLAVEGNALELNSTEQQVTVAPGAQARVDFPAKAVSPGDAKLILTVRGGSHADAMERTMPVFERGIDKFLAQSGKMTTETLEVSLEMPAFRGAGTTFEIQASPSLAVTMLDALPYLADYPYGCVEQTMSRFLPAVVVAKTLKDLGLSEEDVIERTFGGINARKAGDNKQLYNLEAMITSGLERLYDMQTENGGWGWWKGGETDPYMSAYVVWGLTLVEQAGVEIRKDVLTRGREFLELNLVEAENRPDLATWMLHALSARFTGNGERTPSRYETRAFAEVWKERERLNAFTRALLALSAKAYGFQEEASVLVRNLRNGVVVEENPQGSILASGNPENSAMLTTAHWGSDGLVYRWSEGATEATAFGLMALLAVEGESPLSEQVCNWLIQNRRGAQWSNTRDTAITVLALNRYLQISGELGKPLSYEIEVNGEVVAREEIAAGSGVLAPSVFQVDPKLLREGDNRLVFRRTSGEAPLYFSARVNFFTLENPIKAAGNVVFASRSYSLLRPVQTLLDGWEETRVPLENGAALASGDRVEVTLIVEAKNDLEYLVFEDLKAAGLEAVALQSGAPLYARELRTVVGPSGQRELPEADARNRYTGRQRWVYQELRDRQISAFVDKLPEGFWELRYVLRAETPGTFAAMPVLGHAMYVPEIRANSDEFQLRITDKGE